MKPLNLLLCLFGALALPAASQDNPPTPPQRPNVEAMREELRNLPPEQRRERMREMREQFGGNNAGPGRFNGPGAPQFGGMAGRMGGGIERIAAVLTPEQRDSIRTLAEETRPKTVELEEKLRAARAAVLDAAIKKDLSETELREKLEDAAKLETELTLIRAKAFAKMQPPLSAEQIARIKSPPAFGDGNARGGFRPNPRPPGDAPRDENDLPPPARP